MTVGPSTSPGTGTGVATTTKQHVTNQITNLLRIEARIGAAAGDELFRKDEKSGLYPDDGVPDDDQGEMGSDGEDDSEDRPSSGEPDPLRRSVPPPEIEFFADSAGGLHYGVHLMDTADPLLARIAEERFLYLSALAGALVHLQPESLRAEILPEAYLALRPLTQSALETAIKEEIGFAVRESEDGSRVSRHSRVLVRTAGNLIVPVDMLRWGSTKPLADGEEERRIAETRSRFLREALAQLCLEPTRNVPGVVRDVVAGATDDQRLILAMDQVRPSRKGEAADALRQDPNEWLKRARNALRTGSFDASIAKIAETIRKNHLEDVAAVADQPGVVRRHRRRWPATSDADLAEELGITKSGSLVCRLALAGIIGPVMPATASRKHAIRKGAWR